MSTVEVGGKVSLIIPRLGGRIGDGGITYRKRASLGKWSSV